MICSDGEGQAWRKLPSRAAFNKALRALGHSLSLVDLKGTLVRQSGFMPMRLFREEGVEFDVFEGRAATHRAPSR